MNFGAPVFGFDVGVFDLFALEIGQCTLVSGGGVFD
jgi:hypothetical protein